MCMKRRLTREEPTSFQRDSCCIGLYTASHQGWNRKRPVTKDIAKLDHAMLGKCMVQYCSHKSVSTQGSLQVPARARHPSISVCNCGEAFSNQHSCGSNDSWHKVRRWLFSHMKRLCVMDAEPCRLGQLGGCVLEAAKLFLAGCSALLNRTEVRIHKRWVGFGRRAEVRFFFFLMYQLSIL